MLCSPGLELTPGPFTSPSLSQSISTLHAYLIAKAVLHRYANDDLEGRRVHAVGDPEETFETTVAKPDSEGALRIQDLAVHQGVLKVRGKGAAEVPLGRDRALSEWDTARDVRLCVIGARVVLGLEFESGFESVCDKDGVGDELKSSISMGFLKITSPQVHVSQRIFGSTVLQNVFASGWPSWCL